MPGNDAITYRAATLADVPAMALCRVSDPGVGAADHRMAAYLEGKHHPQDALAPRAAFVALQDGRVVGYVAGHRSRRFECDGEVQYLYVARELRRRGVATKLLRLLAQWFHENGATKICVNVDPDSQPAVPFYVSNGASPIGVYWYVWNDIHAALAH